MNDFLIQILRQFFVPWSMGEFIQLWKEGRTRFTNQLAKINQEDLSKRLGGSPNSAGFLIRPIAEAELVFPKIVFGNLAVKVDVQTLKSGRNTGEWTDLEPLLSLTEEAGRLLEIAISSQEDWGAVIETKEFGLFSIICHLKNVPNGLFSFKYNCNFV